MEFVTLKKIPSVLKTKLQIQLPHKANTEHEYRESVQINSIYQLYRPDRDEVRKSVFYNLLKIGKKLVETEGILNHVRRKSKTEQNNYSHQWKDILKKNQDLRELFIENVKFVSENEEKRDRAHAKIAYEQASQIVREAAIADTTKEYKYLFDIKQKFESTLKQFKAYDDFMGMVCNISNGQFRNIEDIMKRYQVLIDKRQEISERRTREFTALDRAKLNLDTFVEKQLLRVMLLNEKMISLTRRHDLAKLKALRWESTVHTIREQLENKCSELDGVTICIWNVYKQICGRRKIPQMKDRSLIDEQLNLINVAIRDASKVYKIARKRISNENHTNTKLKKSRKKRKVSPKLVICDVPNRKSSEARTSLRLHTKKSSEVKQISRMTDSESRTSRFVENAGLVENMFGAGTEI